MARLGKRTAGLVATVLAAPVLVAPVLAGPVLAGPAASAVDAVPGPLTSGDSLYPNQGNGGYDVSHYDLDVAWTPAVPSSHSTVDATATVTAATTGAPLSSFGLDLEGLTVTAVTVDGAPAGATRIEDADGVTPGRHKLVVTPATPVDGVFTVVVDYEGVPTLRGGETAGSDEGWIATADGASFLNQPIGSMTGFPNNNTPKDKATYDITVDVPAGLEVVSNGEPTLPLPDGSGTRSTWSWHQTRPMASELVLISIGQYDVHTSTVSLSGGRSVPEWSFVDATFSSSDKTRFEAQRSRLSEILTGLEAFLGPYPGASTGLVMDKTGVGYALETQDRPTFASAGGVENTIEHELAHQWYGDAVAPADWNGLWVNEGMATWAPTHLAGDTEDTYFDEWRTTPASSPLWDVPPSAMTVPAQLFGWWSYDRGAMTYEALRAAIGDAAYFELIERWPTHFGGQTKHWSDLVDLAGQLSGRDLTAFFQDWVLDPDKPAWPGELTLALAASPAGVVPAGSQLTYVLGAASTGNVTVTGAVVEVDLSQVLDHATLGTLPADVVLDGTTLTWTVPSTPVGATASTSFPVTVPLDAEGAHLSATTTVTTLGGTCAACTVAHTVGPPAPPPPPPPALQTLGTDCRVVVDGRARVGRTLTARLAGCPAGAALTGLQWYAGTKPVAGATGEAWRVKRSKAGRRISVQAAVVAPGYADAGRVSARTRKVRR